MKTPEETKKGLECCNLPGCKGEECPYNHDEPCHFAMHEDALAYIQQLEANQPKWISVKERLPERHDASAGGLVLCVCANADGKPTAKEMHAWHYAIVARMPECFTHWMPLPEPPKED